MGSNPTLGTNIRIMKNKFLQRMADIIVIRILKSRTLKEVEIWLNIGLGINEKLVEKNIYLN